MSVGGCYPLSVIRLYYTNRPGKPQHTNGFSVTPGKRQGNNSYFFNLLGDSQANKLFPNQINLSLSSKLKRPGDNQKTYQSPPT